MKYMGWSYSDLMTAPFDLVQEIARMFIEEATRKVE